MSSVGSFRERLKQRMSAVGDDLCSALEETTVRYEAQIEQQRKMLDVIWKPEVKLYRIDDPHNQAFKKKLEVSNQEQNASVDQKDSEVTD